MFPSIDGAGNPFGIAVVMQAKIAKCSLVIHIEIGCIDELIIDIELGETILGGCKMDLVDGLNGPRFYRIFGSSPGLYVQPRVFFSKFLHILTH